MSSRRTRLAAALLAAIVAATPLAAQAGPDDDGHLLRLPRPERASAEVADSPTGKWLIEFESRPTAAGGNRATIRSQHRGFAENARRIGRPASITHEYTSLFNGVAVAADETTVAAYDDLAGVKAVYPVRLISRPAPQAIASAQQDPLPLTGVDVAQATGLTGAGVKVGIIDGGVDFDHPALGGGGAAGRTAFPSPRVPFGYDFVGDAFEPNPRSPRYSPRPRPDSNPDDCDGHGTHVAGIVGANGANGANKGVAPGVTMGSYRVFGCEGDTDDTYIIAALERAAADGMDVVNLSLGGGWGDWPQHPTSRAADRLVDAGIVVVAASGNDGEYYSQTVGSPAVGRGIIAVASYGFDSLVARYSAWGLAADLSLKPDLGAPGTSIRSTAPLEKGGSATKSGTSMAAPHIAGAAALMLERDPSLTPAQVLARLQNTARPSLVAEATELGVLDPAHRQGAGLVSVDKAIQTTTVVTPSKISAGESADGARTETLTISNHSDAPVTYSLTHTDAAASGVDPKQAGHTQNEMELWRSAARVGFSADSVAVPARGQATVAVTIQADPDSFAGTTYGGFVHLDGSDGQRLNVPFAGLAGDYGSLPVFHRLDGRFPALGLPEACERWDSGACAEPYRPELHTPSTVYAGGAETPAVLAHLAWPVTRLTMDLLKVDANGRPVASSAQTALRLDHLGRSTGVDAFEWDGRVRDARGAKVQAEPGRYVLRLTALAADGDGSTQTWTSPAFWWLKNTSEYERTAPYTLPGTHALNGRDWHTSCEPYSKTERCRTTIWATVVAREGDSYVRKQGWAFNNLTYLPFMTRGEWGANPLARPGAFTSAGRRWRTECDTPATGRGACRSYILSTVYTATARPTGGYAFGQTNQWQFNNMVIFKR